MAKTNKQSGADIDWYLISIDRLKKIGVLVLLAALLGGGYFYWNRQQTNPRLRAENAISDARESLNELASMKDFSSFKSEFDRGQLKLDEARRFLSAKGFVEAEAAAVESQTIVKTALSRQPGTKESDAQFITVDGEVQFQKASSSDWKKAEVRTPLLNGDWVKTGNNASAELIFSNGSLYTIGPDALLEIYAAVNPATSKKQNSVQMQVGTVEINTADDESTVRTPGTQVVINSESTAQVGVDRTQKSTQVVNLKGGASVSPAAGGAAIALEPGQQVQASREGTISPVSRFVPAPALIAPADQQLYQTAESSKVSLSWAKHPLAAAYQLQVSRSRLFAGLEINARRTDPSASTSVTSTGTYYWRVASIDSSGRTGPFSPFRRFRVAGIGQDGGQTAIDKTPPTLELKRPFNIGGQFYMIEGRVESGASLTINEQEVDVESDGAFKKLVSFDKVGWNKVVVKAVDAAGNQNIKSENVHVEE